MVVLVPLVPHGAAAAAAAPGWWWCCGRAGSQGGVGCDRCVVVWVFGVFFFGCILSFGLRGALGILWFRVVACFGKWASGNALQ